MAVKSLSMCLVLYLSVLPNASAYEKTGLALATSGFQAVLAYDNLIHLYESYKYSGSLAGMSSAS